MAETLHVSAEAPATEVLDAAVRVLAGGGLLIYPTDTLYALGCRAADGRAAQRVRAAKRRDEGKPLPLVAADLAQVETLCGPFAGAAAALARRFWPGPLTLVVPLREALPAAVTAGAADVAIRVPRLALARELCLRAGPLVSTSANRSDEAPPATCADAVAAVGEAAELALDAGRGGGPPSTIVDLTGAQPRLLRTGAVPWSQVAAALRGPLA